MNFFILPKHYYNRFRDIDFVRLFADIDSIGFRVLNSYGISSYDMFLILDLNFKMGQNITLYNKFLDYYKGKEFEIFNTRDWLNCESEDDIGQGICEFKAYNTDFLLIIVKYDFFKELKVGNSYENLLNYSLDYIYSNFGEEVALNNNFFDQKILKV